MVKTSVFFFFLLLESGLCNVEVGIFFLPQWPEPNRWLQTVVSYPISQLPRRHCELLWNWGVFSEKLIEWQGKNWSPPHRPPPYPQPPHPPGPASSNTHAHMSPPLKPSGSDWTCLFPGDKGPVSLSLRSWKVGRVRSGSLARAARSITASAGVVDRKKRNPALSQRCCKYRERESTGAEGTLK